MPTIPPLPSADGKRPSVVSREVQEGLLPIFTTGRADEDRDGLLERLAHEPIRMFNAATQDLLAQFPHINEQFPRSDAQLIATLDFLQGKGPAPEEAEEELVVTRRGTSVVNDFDPPQEEGTAL